MSVEVIDKIVPKNGAFVGLVDASQIVGDGNTNVLPLNCLPPITGVSMPTGGTAGQQLVKTSGTNYATNWANVSAVNVKLAFNVQADGKTDDTIAMQTAIDSGAAALYWPAGTYIHTQLNQVSGQIWVGDGMFATEFSLAQVNVTPNFNGITAPGDIDSVQYMDMGFRGNVNEQTTQDFNGQNLWGFFFRLGACTNLVWERCRVYEYGQNTGAIGTRGGGAIGVGAVTGSHTLENIAVRNCVIGDCGNVPGVYFSAKAVPVNGSAKNLRVTGNKFYCYNTYGIQNMVYAPGFVNQIWDNVDISGNQFDLEQPFDTSIEINWTRNFRIENNTFSYKNNAGSEGILIRSGCESGVVAGNVIANYGSGSTNHQGITLVSFANADINKGITISGNTIKDFGVKAIAVETTCYNVTVIGNTISGEMFTPECGISIANVKNVLVANNVMRNVGVPINIGGNYIGVTNLTMLGNHMHECGAVGNSLISTPVLNIFGENIVAINNKVYSPKAGTVAFWGASLQSSKGNHVLHNDLPVGFNLVNRSYLQYIERQVSPAVNDGPLVVGNSYSFLQGEIDLVKYQTTINWDDPDAQKSSITFGANLDDNFPVCEIGDQVLVGSSSDLTGTQVSGFVLAAKQVRVVISNMTTDSLNVAAGTWYITIIRKPPYTTVGGMLRVGSLNGIYTDRTQAMFTINGVDVTIGGNNSIATK